MPSPYHRRINFAEARLEANIRRVLFDTATVNYFADLIAHEVAERVAKIIWKRAMEDAKIKEGDKDGKGRSGLHGCYSHAGLGCDDMHPANPP